MIKTKLLTPGLIQQIITEEEIPLRSRTFAPETVHEVFRYGAIIGNAIEKHSRIHRGMDRARELICSTEEAKLSLSSGTVILAHEMVGSRGRFNRSWHAPQGGLWMTVVLVNTLLPENSLLIPMAAGISCCELMRDYGIPAYIKWVNDVLTEGKKISGILVETFTGPRYGEEYVLIGIGINVNNDFFPPELVHRAVSLKSCLNREISLAETAAGLLAKLRWNIGLLYYEETRHLEFHGGMAKPHETPGGNLPDHDHFLLQSFNSLTDMDNRRVLFGFDVQENPQFEAKVVGLDSSGGLILELDDGSRTVQYSGEIIYLD
jgi:BirA family biotin operon repressor/biotin-[acetyl-CoA-carboxylase] ligase